MIHESQEAPQTFLVEQPGTDSVADHRNAIRVQFSTDALQRYRLKSLADLTQVPYSRVCKDEPQAAVMSESAQKPVEPLTQKHWGRTPITPH